MVYVSIWRRVLGTQFELLPEKIQTFRDDPKEARGIGKASVTSARGSFSISGFVALLGGLPSTNPYSSFEGIVKVVEDKQYWTRNFDGQLFTSVMSVQNEPVTNAPILLESSGPITFGYRVHVTTKPRVTTHYDSEFTWLFGFKIPQFMAPKSSWKETSTVDGWHFEGRIDMPLGLGRLIEYEGTFIISSIQSNLLFPPGPFAREKIKTPQLEEMVAALETERVPPDKPKQDHAHRSE